MVGRSVGRSAVQQAGHPCACVPVPGQDVGHAGLHVGNDLLTALQQRRGSAVAAQRPSVES